MNKVFFDLQRFSVYGSEGNDRLNVNGSYSYVFAYGGNDTVYNGAYSFVTIDAGAGDDLIQNRLGYYISVNGGAGNDKISLSSIPFGVSVTGGTGNDTIYGNAGSYFGAVYQYNSGDGYDVIYNWNSADKLIFGDDVSYTRSTVGSNVIISPTSGGAIYLMGASGKTVNVTGGTLTVTTSGGKNISNTNTNSLVSGTDYADTIKNYAGGVTISGGNGDDSIYSSTFYTVQGAYGHVTIDGGAGSDTITNNDPNVSIGGGAGNDVVNLSGYWSGVTVNAGAGNDTVYTASSRYNGVMFQYAKGDGFDYLKNWSGNDTLSLDSGIAYSKSTVGSNVVISLEGGAITLEGASGKTINIIGGYTPTSSKGTLISNSSSNVVLTGTNYADTISNSYGSNVTVNAGRGNDTIYSWADKVTVNGGDGKDSLTGGYSNSKINGDGGNDLISLTGSYWRNTIGGGAGKDTITAAGDEHSVNGGAGADRISLSGDKLTVSGGKGNDVIYGSTATSHLYEYAKGDGSDIIYNWSSNDSLTITGGATWTKSTSGNNVIINVKGSGKITLSGAANKTVNVYPTATPTDEDPTPTTVTSAVSQQDIIKKFMKSLDTTSYSGISALNEAVSVATGGYFSNLNAAVNQMVDDCNRTGNATTFLKTYCDIDLDNDDTGAITGFDAGGSSTQKGASDIVPESGGLNSFTGNYFTTNGLTVQLASFDRYFNPYNISYTSLTNNTQRYIWQAFQTWWASGALNLISESYGSNYGFGSNSSAPVKKLNFGFENENSGVMATTYFWTNPSTGKNTQLAMTVNMHNYDSLVIGDSDGKISNYNSFYLDRVLAHEFTHAVMAANINHFGNLPMFVSEGMAELTHGTDDDRKSEILALARNSSSLSNALNNDSYSSYAGGYMFLRYLAKQGSEHYPSSNSSGNASSSRAVSSAGGNSSSVSIKGSVLTVAKDFNDDMLDLTTYSSAVKKVDATSLIDGIMIIGNQSANSISTGSGNDTINSNTGNDMLDGGAGDDIIKGDAGNDLISGGLGNDTLFGGTGNDTLIGGAGNDVFVHKTENDIITDYTPGEDKIKLAEENASITAASLSGSDVVLTVGIGSVTVKDGKGKKITVVDYNNKSTSSVYGGSSDNSSTLTITNKSNSSVTLGSAYQNADASARTKKIKITGNSKANTILGGSKNDTIEGRAGNDSLVGNAGADKIYGGAGKDTLIGGKGNDSLWGNAGADTFIYESGDGKDIIYGFDKNDTLTLDNIEFTTSYSKKNKAVSFNMSGGSVTLKDFTASIFHVNGDVYKISGSEFVKN